MDLREQYIKCCEDWKYYLDCKENNEDTTIAMNLYKEDLNNLGIKENTIFSIWFEDNSSYSAIGVSFLDKYIRSNYKYTNLIAFNKVYDI